jgi:hypothetical protein
MISSHGVRQIMADILSGLDITYNGIISLLLWRPAYPFQADLRVIQFGKFYGE